MRGTDNQDLFSSCFHHFLSHDELSGRKKTLVINKYIGFFKLKLNEIIEMTTNNFEKADYKKYELELEYNNMKSITKRMLDIKLDILEQEKELNNNELWLNNSKRFLNYLTKIELEHYESVMNKNSNNMNENSIKKRRL